ncbi:MAG: DUF881 domain-containing protein [Micrococcales bacterium]|nr:DUF881 domain-containing protein [Micrococcales bacterium]
MRRPDQSMTLLTGFMERPLDPSYAAAADAREAAGMPRGTSSRTPLVVITAVLLGLLFSVAAATLNRSLPGTATAREELAAQVAASQAAADRRRAAVQQTQAEIDRVRAAQLATANQGALTQEVAALELRADAVAVTGPGMVLTLDDAPGGADSADGDPRTGAQADGKVLARDVQLAVNGLWAAGAEAVAVNGQRLSARSAIRFAGDAILVNYRPLARPYVISAIGDPGRLPADFAEGPGGSYVQALADSFGVQVSTKRSESLTLPAAHITTELAEPTGAPTGAAGKASLSPNPTPEDPS